MRALRSKRVLLGATAIAAGMLAAVAGPGAFGQMGEGQDNVMYLPIGEPNEAVIGVERRGPSEVRVGQTLEYQIVVENMTDQSINQVKITEMLPSNMTLENAQPQPDQQKQQGQGQMQQSQRQQQGQMQGRQGSRQQDQAQQNRQNRPQQGNRQQGGQQQSRAQQQGGQGDVQLQRQAWTIGEEAAQMAGDNQGQQQNRQQAQRQQQRQQQAQRDSQDDQPRAQMAQARQQGQRQAQQGGQQQQQDRQRQQGQRQQNQKGQQGQMVTWNLGTLSAGETRTINVSAVVERAGEMESCISVSYEPTLCTTIVATNPQIQITKQAPQEVDICDPIEIVYVVRNTGTGPARNVEVIDSLGEGLMTAEGTQSFQQTIDTLPAGEERRLTVRAMAEQPGEYGSRAVAQMEGEKNQSQRTTTTVIAPELTMQVEAQNQRVQVGEPVMFNVTVTNNGQAAAEATKLALRAPESGTIAQVNMQRQPGEAQQAGGRMEQGAEGENVIGLGTIQPGQSRTVQVQMATEDQGEVILAAGAAARCPTAQELGLALAEGTATAQAIALPALVVEVTDTNDPINVGEQTTYEIAVKNQGRGVAERVQLSGQLPQGVKFVGAETDGVKSQGGNLQFPAIQNLPGGEVRSFYVTVEATEQAGPQQFRLEVTAPFLDKPVIETEPTRLR